MRQYSTAELDLMAKVYDRCCDELLALDGLRPRELEAVRSRLVSGLVEAIERGERNEARLMRAALRQAGFDRISNSRTMNDLTRPVRATYPAAGHRPSQPAEPAE
jgi:VIT1/CCC1 family predicted Fe2+/Mn2+ transporter